MTAPELVGSLLVRLEWLIIVYFLLVNGFYAILLVSAGLEMRRYIHLARGEGRHRILATNAAPTISMLAPAYDEASTITQSVRALLTLAYPNLEVVVVNDGSTDATLQVLQHAFDLVPIHPIYRRQVDTKLVRGLYRSRSQPRLVVVDKENGGKADSLNAGLNFTSAELVCAIDADTIIEADALQRMVRPFLTEDDVLAAGGTIRVANHVEVRDGRVVRAEVPKRLLSGIQVVEYLRAFLFGRLGWNRLGGNLIISGAFGLFRRDAMVATGGYANDTVGEDMELVVRLRREGYETGGPTRVSFIPDPVAWTEVPEKAAVLGRQRDRWHRGLADALWRHRALLFNRRYGVVGWIAFPFFVFVELLSPVVEAIGLIGLFLGLATGIIDWPFALLFFLVAYGLGILLSLFTLVLEAWSFHRYERLRDFGLLLLWSVFEHVGYRQLTVYWRIRGLIRYLLRRSDWGVMERSGFESGEQTSRLSS